MIRVQLIRCLSILCLAATAAAGSEAQQRLRIKPAAPPKPPELTGPVIQLPPTELTPRQQALHVLNRLGYGPRPGEIDEVLQVGIASTIRRQLEPQSLNDADAQLRLLPYKTLGMDSAELLSTYPPPQLIRQVAQNLRKHFSPDQVDQLFPEIASAQQDQEARKPMAETMRTMSPFDTPRRVAVELAQAKLVRAIYSERQLQEVMVDFWFNHFNVYVGKGADRWWIANYERTAIRPHALGRFRDLLGAVARHPAMLFYLDNHLSSAEGVRFGYRQLERYSDLAIAEQGLPPGGVVTLLLRNRGMDTEVVERRARRAAALRSPRPGPRNTRRMRRTERPIPGRSGLNENYARELLELHTLGVDGGYTQQDIVEVARCFTGWSLLPLKAGQHFVFIKELHDDGKKVVLGQEIQGKGQTEGERVLDLLAAHPATARFIATKLARRFVSDEPAPELVERLARRFQQTDGDIAEVLRALFSDPVFWSTETYRAKIKTPFEFVVSAARASAAELSRRPVGQVPTGMLSTLRRLGQPPYGAEPPTGYKDEAVAWVSTGALLNRMAFAVSFAGNRIPGVRAYYGRLGVGSQRTADVATWLPELAVSMLGEPPDEATLSALEAQLALPQQKLAALGMPGEFNKPKAKLRVAAAWLLAAPQFQRR